LSLEAGRVVSAGLGLTCAVLTCAGGVEGDPNLDRLQATGEVWADRAGNHAVFGAVSGSNTQEVFGGDFKRANVEGLLVNRLRNPRAIYRD
jgi:hypothetical protein